VNKPSVAQINHEHANMLWDFGDSTRTQQTVNRANK